MSSPPSDPSSGGGGGGDGGSAVPGTASSNFTLLYIIIAVLVGVILYMAIRYGRSVMSEWRQLQAGGGGGGRHGGEPHAALLGLSSDDIDALPTFTYRARGGASPLVGGGGRRGGSGKGKGVMVVECVVCLQELADGDVVRVLPACRHFFHGGCIDLWLRAHSTCPVCRAHPEPDGVRLSDVAVSPPLPQLRRCGLSPERPTAPSRVLADILARSPLRGNNTSTTSGGPITSTSKSPSPVQAAINYVQASRSPSPTAYRSVNERWSSSPPTQIMIMPEVVVVRSNSPSPSPPIGGLSRETSAAARGVGVVEGVDASATTSASASAPLQALSKEGGGSRSKSPSPVPH